MTEHPTRPSSEWDYEGRVVEHVARLDTEIERLRGALEQARRYMKAVASSPVCHVHNVIALRDGIAYVDRVLDNEGNS